MSELREKLERWADEVPFDTICYDEPSYINGAYGMLALLWPVIEAQVEFNRKFSPGENWYPEFERVLSNLEEKLK